MHSTGLQCSNPQLDCSLVSELMHQDGKTHLQIILSQQYDLAFKSVAPEEIKTVGFNGSGGVNDKWCVMIMNNDWLQC